MPVQVDERGLVEVTLSISLMYIQSIHFEDYNQCVMPWSLQPIDRFKWDTITESKWLRQEGLSGRLLSLFFFSLSFSFSLVLSLFLSLSLSHFVSLSKILIPPPIYCISMDVFFLIKLYHFICITLFIEKTICLIFIS